MSVPVTLQDNDGTILHVEKVGPHTHLIFEDHSRVATQFKSIKSTSAETVVAVRPRAGGAIVITDIVASGEKASNGSIIVQFTDGSDTVVLTELATVTNGLAIAIPFSGRIRGWQDARIDVITAGTNPVSNVLVAYYHLVGEGGTLSFADWDAQR